MASSTQWHSSPNTNLVALSRSMNHLKSMDDALNQRSTRHWVASGPNQLHVFKNSAIQSTSQTRFSAHIMRYNFRGQQSNLSSHRAWLMYTGKGAQISSGVNGLCPRFPPRNPINSTILTQLANSLSFKFWSNYSETVSSIVSRLKVKYPGCVTYRLAPTSKDPLTSTSASSSLHKTHGL